MEKFDLSLLKKLYIPARDSHKGQNGKVLVIGGSELFHSSAFWALEIASKIVDIVYFSSTPMNNEIVKKLKTKFVNGIIVSRENLNDYIEEADSVLIGPGLPRPDGQETGDDDTKILTEKLLLKFPNKKWVIDGGSLQVIEPSILPKTAIITPNVKEFEMLFRNVILEQSDRISVGSYPLRRSFLPRGKAGSEASRSLRSLQDDVVNMAGKFGIIILLKGPIDVVANSDQAMEIPGGNAGMTKGGTGDVLAGLVAAFYAKNDAFLSAVCASFINKKAGESLAEKAGLYFNASDLVNEIPKIMKKYI